LALEQERGRFEVKTGSRVDGDGHDSIGFQVKEFSAISRPHGLDAAVRRYADSRALPAVGTNPDFIFSPLEAEA